MRVRLDKRQSICLGAHHVGEANRYFQGRHFVIQHRSRRTVLQNGFRLRGGGCQVSIVHIQQIRALFVVARLCLPGRRAAFFQLHPMHRALALHGLCDVFVYVYCVYLHAHLVVVRISVLVLNRERNAFLCQLRLGVCYCVVRAPLPVALHRVRAHKQPLAALRACPRRQRVLHALLQFHPRVADLRAHHRAPHRIRYQVARAQRHALHGALQLARRRLQRRQLLVHTFRTPYLLHAAVLQGYNLRHRRLHVNRERNSHPPRLRPVLVRHLHVKHRAAAAHWQRYSLCRHAAFAVGHFRGFLYRLHAAQRDSQHTAAHTRPQRRETRLHQRPRPAVGDARGGTAALRRNLRRVTLVHHAPVALRFQGNNARLYVHRHRQRLLVRRQVKRCHVSNVPH